MQRIFLLTLFTILLAPASAALAQDEPAPMDGMTMHVFMSETCPHCRAQKPFLADLEASHPSLEIVHMEVMTTREHHDLLRNMASLHGVQPGSVPMVFFGGRVWTGDNPQIRREIVDHVEACLSGTCPAQ